MAVVGGALVGFAINLIKGYFTNWGPVENYLVFGILSILPLVPVLFQVLAYHNQFGKIPGLDSDMIGLIAVMWLGFAFSGSSLAASALGWPGLALWIDLVSLVLAIILAANAVVDIFTWSDQLGGLLGKADEILSWVI